MVDSCLHLDQLAILGKAVDHEDQIDLILEGLSDDYKTVVDQVEGRDLPPSITELHERLLNHEAKLLTATDDVLAQAPITANVAQHRNNHSANLADAKSVVSKDTVRKGALNFKPFKRLHSNHHQPHSLRGLQEQTSRLPTPTISYAILMEYQ